MTTLNNIYENEEKMAATIAMLHDEIKLLGKLLIAKECPTKTVNSTDKIPDGFVNAIQFRQSETVRQVINAVDEVRFIRSVLEGTATDPVVAKDNIDKIDKSVDDLKTEASLADHITFDGSSHSLEKE